MNEVDYCVNCGAKLPDTDKRKWKDYCDKCKKAFKKGYGIKKVDVFV